MTRKLPNHQQQRWNRHYNYALDDDPIAKVIWKHACRWMKRDQITVKDILKCSREARAQLMHTALAHETARMAGVGVADIAAFREPHRTDKITKSN